MLMKQVLPWYLPRATRISSELSKKVYALVHFHLSTKICSLT
jgi:hypothetical protein